MSKLNFSNIEEAFVLGSEQIKNTQAEIANLKKIIMDSSISNPGSDNPGSGNPDSGKPGPSNYERIGPPDRTQVNFEKGDNEFNLENNFFKMVQHPRFDDLVYKYVHNNHPDWVLRDKEYTGSKSNFGKTYNKYSTTICSDIKNYLIFFTISIAIYLLLSLLVKKVN